MMQQPLFTLDRLPSTLRIWATNYLFVMTGAAPFSMQSFVMVTIRGSSERGMSNIISSMVSSMMPLTTLVWMPFAMLCRGQKMRNIKANAAQLCLKENELGMSHVFHWFEAVGRFFTLLELWGVS